MRSVIKMQVADIKLNALCEQACGFRDMAYFKLRLYHIHEQRYAFVG